MRDRATARHAPGAVAVATHLGGPKELVWPRFCAPWRYGCGRCLAPASHWRRSAWSRSCWSRPAHCSGFLRRTRRLGVGAFWARLVVWRWQVRRRRVVDLRQHPCLRCRVACPWPPALVALFVAGMALFTGALGIACSIGYARLPARREPGTRTELERRRQRAACRPSASRKRWRSQRFGRRWSGYSLGSSRAFRGCFAGLRLHRHPACWIGARHGRSGDVLRRRIDRSVPRRHRPAAGLGAYGAS